MRAWNSPITIAASALALWLFSGCASDKVAGTSTTTGNTITGVALDAGGQPIAGAQASLRSMQYLPSAIAGGSQPLPKLAAALPPDTSVITDSSGRFSFSVTQADTFFVEIIQNNQYIAWIKNVIATGVDGDTNELSQVTMTFPSTLNGIISQSADNVVEMWIGIPGTDNFVQMDAQGNFQLDKLPQGLHDIQIIRIIENGSVVTRETFFLQDISIREGVALQMENVQLPDDNTGVTAFRPLTCVDQVDTLVGEKHFLGTGRPNQILHTLMMANSPTLIEIDLCKGVWRNIVTLPDTARPSAFMSGNGSDYVFSNTNGLVYYYDTTARSLQTSNYQHQWDLGDIWEGRWYIGNRTPPSLLVYPSLEELLGYSASDTLLGPGDSTTHLSVYNSNTYYLGGTDVPVLATVVNGTNVISDSTALDYAGQSEIAGLKAVSESEVYLLTTDGTLYLTTPSEGLQLGRWFIATESTLFGLSAY